MTSAQWSLSRLGHLLTLTFTWSQSFLVMSRAVVDSKTNNLNTVLLTHHMWLSTAYLVVHTDDLNLLKLLTNIHLYIAYSGIAWSL